MQADDARYQAQQFLAWHRKTGRGSISASLDRWAASKDFGRRDRRAIEAAIEDELLYRDLVELGGVA